MVEERACNLRVDGPMLVNAALVESGTLLVEDGRVLYAGERKSAPRCTPDQQLTVRKGLVSPGFINLHVHGGGGADAADGTAEALVELSRTHARHGTTALCPTIVSCPPPKMLTALERVREAAHADSFAPRVLGANLEGPFLSPRRCGAQPAEHLLAPDLVLLQELLDAAGDALAIMTVAPELPGALAVIERLAAHGVVAAIGHSDATAAEASRAVAAGARLATHLFNGMRPLHHREPGVAGVMLAQDAVFTEVIADGIHSSPLFLQLAWRLKRERLVLVSDCLAALESATEARLGERGVSCRDGAAWLADGTLAGSLITLERAAGNMVRLAGMPLVDALAAITLSPARLLGRSTLGNLKAGAEADFVVLTPDVEVEQVFVAGKALT